MWMLLYLVDVVPRRWAIAIVVFVALSFAGFVAAVWQLGQQTTQGDALSALESLTLASGWTTQQCGGRAACFEAQVPVLLSNGEARAIAQAFGVDTRSVNCDTSPTTSGQEMVCRGEGQVQTLSLVGDVQGAAQKVSYSITSTSTGGLVSSTTVAFSS